MLKLLVLTGTIVNEISQHIGAEFGSPITLVNYIWARLQLEESVVFDDNIIFSFNVAHRKICSCQEICVEGIWVTPTDHLGKSHLA